LAPPERNSQSRRMGDGWSSRR